MGSENTMKTGENPANLSDDQREELRLALIGATQAYEDDNSALTMEFCDEALAIDPDNPEAWLLRAKFGGWDSKMYTMDCDYAISCAERAISLQDPSRRYQVAADIYVARKHQIAKLLESQMMLPSLTSAKQMHETMQHWQRFLAEIPCLTPGLIEGEVALCKNLCMRSKLGVMPGDRLVYTAYATLNDKVSYGDMFEANLQERIEGAKQRKQQIMNDVLARIEARRQSSLSLIESGDLSPEQERERLQEDLASLTCDLGDVIGLSDRLMYKSQLEEVRKKRAELKPTKIFKKKELDEQIAQVEEKIAQIDAEIAPVVQPLQDEISAIESRLFALGE
ncbi:MAG: hypothetical protein ACI37P_03250 [Eggerthellaceae bacterium]